MKVIQTSIVGVLIIEPKCFGDRRGFFIETFEVNRYAAAGIARPFVQDNLSRSSRGVLRGLHLQNPNPQGKLVNVLHGCILDVVVDVRVGSPTFGQHLSFELNEAKRLLLWAPRGFAHGFLVVSALAIDWGIDKPIVSVKDNAALLLADIKG
jgi:dTDP-4-dehydrorhamnose 3,5-epimerase